MALIALTFRGEKHMNAMNTHEYKRARDIRGYITWNGLEGNLAFFTHRGA